MRRLLGHVAEVIRRGDKALAEVLKPDAVHGDTGGQRVVLARNGLRQLQATAALGVGLAGTGREDIEELARGDRATLILITAQVDITIAGTVRIRHGHGFARDARVRKAEFVDLREAEMAGRGTVALATVDGAILPIVTELAGVEHRDEFLVIQDTLHVRHGPRVVG